MTTPSVLAAQRLVACGLNVIPLRPGEKTPAMRWERFQRERLVERDWEQVDAYLHSWWDPERLDSPCECGATRAWGPAMPCQHAPHEPVPRPVLPNVGVVTGSVSEVVVVDVDSDDARSLVERTCGWPRTVTTKTAKGWHLWFRYPGETRNGVRRAESALDVRGDGGYVVVPPSRHPSSVEYTWDVSPFTFSGGMWPPIVMPDELHALLLPTRKVTPTGAVPTILTTKYIDVALEREVAAVSSASQGSRNDQLNRSAYSLARFVRDGALPAATYVEKLTAAASHAGLPETEIRRTLASALQGRT